MVPCEGVQGVGGRIRNQIHWWDFDWARVSGNERLDEDSEKGKLRETVVEVWRQDTFDYWTEKDECLGKKL